MVKVPVENKKKKQTIYLSIDVETDGPIPGAYSMLSFGVAAFNSAGRVVDTFEANLGLLPDAKQNPDTMAWWYKDKKQTALYVKTRENIKSPTQAMKEYVLWQEGIMKKHNARLCYMGYPIVFDQMFVYWYAMYFAGEDHAGFNGIDIKTYASAALQRPYKKTYKKTMPRRWFSDRPHTHIAIDDALEQGELGINIMKELKVL
jgi:hypothetical protein